MVDKINKKTLDRIIKEYLDVLKSNGITVYRAYLFGSHAKRTSYKDSDIDLAIFMNSNKIDNFDEDVRLMRLRRGVDMNIEPRSFSISDYKNPDPFIEEILSTGRRMV